MKSDGSVFYQDEYEQTYKINWMSSDGLIDLTSIVEQPYVWGKAKAGYKDGRILFKHGVVTITRQVLRPLINGYEIVAEGVSQYEDYVQINYKCGPVPKDNFSYHLNNAVTDAIEAEVTDGVCWADPDYPEPYTVWPDVGISGTDDVLSPTSVDLILTWLDVWA